MKLKRKVTEFGCASHGSTYTEDVDVPELQEGDSIAECNRNTITGEKSKPMTRTVTELGSAFHGLTYTEDVDISALRGEEAKAFYKSHLLDFIKTANEQQLSYLYSLAASAKR